MRLRGTPPARGASVRWLVLAFLQCWHAAGDEPSAEGPTACPELDDENGRWEGSRAVGGQYTLRCAKGFKVSGRQGTPTGSMICPKNLEWPEELKCEDIDNCDELQYGCGAKGICIDLVNGYDCNCEKGYPRRRGRNGEIECGDEADEDICGGNTCGSYGLCLDLKSKFPGAAAAAAAAVAVAGRGGQAKKPFRCECADGFFDNGTTCVRRDCGTLHDELGTWSGSTLFNEEYKLECPRDSFVWGQFGLRDITIRCSRRGDWLAHPVCHSPAQEARDARYESLRRWSSLLCVLLCVCSAALAAGLTLGLATLEPFGLTVVMATSEEHCRSREAKEKLRRDQVNARLVLPLVRDHHRLLVTLMLFNTLANESLPIFLDELVPSWAAVLISVSVVLICGEILPSAIFTGPSQMRIAGTCVPLVRFMQWLFHYIATPIIALLDRVIEQEDQEGSVKYSRAELRALLQLHGHHGEEEREGHGGAPRAGGAGEEVSHVSSLSAAGGALACLLGQHASEERPHEPRHEEEGHEAGPSILAAAELQLVNGALDLQDAALDDVPYTKRRQCAAAGREHLASEVLALNLLGAGQRAVLVLHSDGGPQRRLQRASTSSLRCPLVSAEEVCGCLRSRDVVHGGRKALGTLCAEPLVLVPDWLTALEALRLLVDGGSSMGVVVHGAGEHGTVQGVVSRAEILGVMLAGKRRRASTAASGGEAPGLLEAELHGGGPVVPTPNRRHVGHRPLFTRCPSSLEPSRSGPLHRGRAATTNFEAQGTGERRLSA